MRKPALAAFFSAIFLVSPSFAQTAKKSATSTPITATARSSAASPAAKLQGLDDLASSAMKQWKVPGVAIAVELREIGRAHV